MERLLYLATATVLYTPYMGNAESSDQMRLVWANSKEEACEKFVKYFEDRNVEYSMSYRVMGFVDIDEAIS